MSCDYEKQIHPRPPVPTPLQQNDNSNFYFETCRELLPLDWRGIREGGGGGGGATEISVSSSFIHSFSASFISPKIRTLRTNSIPLASDHCACDSTHFLNEGQRS